jgi:chromosome partitioning protein
MVQSKNKRNKMTGTKKAKLIAIVNQKGGSCKTTTARTLQYHLAMANQKVLVIDIDPQGSMTSWLGLNPNELENSPLEASRIYATNTMPADAVTTEFGCDLLPAFPPELRDKNRRADFSIVFMLKKFLATVEDKYDYVIVDTPGTLDNLTQSAIIACPTLVVPMQTAPIDQNGTEGFFRGISEIIENGNCKVDQIFIVPSMFNKRAKSDNKILFDIQHSIVDFLSSLHGFNGTSILVTEPIPLNSSIKEAFDLGTRVSPQESLKDKYKKAVLDTINNVCNDILGV